MKKLTLGRETLESLDTQNLDHVVGGLPLFGRCSLLPLMCARFQRLAGGGGGGGAAAGAGAAGAAGGGQG